MTNKTSANSSRLHGWVRKNEVMNLGLKLQKWGLHEDYYVHRESCHNAYR